MNQAFHTVAVPGNSTIRQFENRIADYCQSGFALSVCNATMGILGVFHALGLSGEEIITTPLTWPGALSGPLALGCRFRFCDVEPETLTINPGKLESVITRKTKAVFSADVLGYPARLDEIKAVCRKHDIILIHDAASSFGSSYKGQYSGFYADVTVLSFGARKLFTAGEGGCMVTGNRRVYNALLKSLAHPERQDIELESVNPFALNTRMNPLAAQYGLDTFEQQLQRIRTRQRHARLIMRKFNLSEPPFSCRPNYYRILMSHGVWSNIRSSCDDQFEALPFPRVIYKERGIKNNISTAGRSCPVAEAAVQEFRVFNPV